MRTRTRRVAPPALRLLHLVSWPSYGDEPQTPSARLPPHSLSHLDMLHGCERFAPHCSPPGPFDWRPESGLLPDKDFREVPSARVWDMRAFWRERHGSHPAATRARRNATRPSISCTRVGVRARGGGRTRGVRPRRGLRREEGTAGSGCGAGAEGTLSARLRLGHALLARADDERAPRVGALLLGDLLGPVRVHLVEGDHVLRHVDQQVHRVVHRPHDEVVEAQLVLGHVGRGAVEHRRHGQAEAALLVALCEEL
mmetsp:Transcript_6578/g.15438  ORF Transcript_6578/g.15438 Transcript_6578/m.15438 type:complete len:255 (-) Transcript_6578:1521-2285(-)